MKKKLALALLLISLTTSFMFVIKPVWADSFLDNFNDGDYNGWTASGGTWSVVSGKLNGQGSLSPIYTNVNFPSDRTVQSELKTETPGGAPYDVAVLMVKWVNLQNQIDVRIFTDGTIELIMWKNGNNAHTTTVSSTLSPSVSHIFTASVAGTNIKIWIDGNLKIDATDSDFDDIAGAVGYQTSASCKFDDMSVSYSPQSSTPSLVVYGYDNYGRAVTASVYIDGQYYGTTNSGQTWTLSSGSHSVQVSVPGGNSFYRFISNNLSATNAIYNYTNPWNDVVVNYPRTLTAYYTTSNPPQPQGYDYAPYGRASMLYSTDWLMLSKDLADVNTAFSQIYNQFDANSYYYHHLKNYQSQTTWDSVSSEIDDGEYEHGWATVFYYGHMGIDSNGNPPFYNYGIHVQANPADQNPSDTIWDNATKAVPTNGGHHFVFLWVCNNGNDAGNSTPRAHGAAYCWTNQPDLSGNGYSDPDYRQYCFISFQGASVTLMEGMGTYNSTENSYRYWLNFFYYYALNGNTINEALYWASRAVNCPYGWIDPQNNRLYQGYNYTWWGGGGQSFNHIFGKMRIYGNGNIDLV